MKKAFIGVLFLLLAFITLPNVVNAAVTYIDSVELHSDIAVPRYNADIPAEPAISIVKFNEDLLPDGIATITSVWQVKTGDGFFDWHDASGKFEADKIYHLRMMITISSENYEFNRSEAYQNVTINDLELIQFQENELTIGKFSQEYYVEKEYEVTFDFNGGTKNSASIEVKHWVPFGYILSEENLLEDVTAPEGRKLYAVEVDGVKKELNSVLEINKDMTIKYLWTTNIEAIHINGINAPVGESVPTTKGISIQENGIKIKSANWYEDKASWQSDGPATKFTAGKKYLFIVMLELEDGFDLKDDLDISSNIVPQDKEYVPSGPDIRLKFEASNPPSIKVVSPSVKTKNANNNTLLVSWNNQTNATKYEVYRSTSKTKNFKKIKTLTTNSFTDKGLVYGKTYYYKVKAIGPKNSKTSSVVKGKTIPNKVKLSIKSASTNNVKLAWDKVSVTGYEVYMGTKTSNMKKVATITKSKTITYNKTKLKANTKYYFKAKAYKTVSGKKVYGTWSDIVSTKTAPKVATVSFKQNANNMTVTISKVSGASYHEYAISEIKSFKLGLEAGVMNNSSIIPSIIPVTKGKTYYVKVRSCNSEKRCSAWKVYSKLTK